MKTKPTIAVDLDNFNDATMRIKCAGAIVTAFGVFMEEARNDAGSVVSGHVMNEAMMGVKFLLDDAYNGLEGLSKDKTRGES